MKNLLTVLLLSALTCMFFSCGEDEPEEMASDCEGVLAAGGEMLVDGETLALSIAQLLISEGFDGDTYQFQIGGLSNDCNLSTILAFIIEIPKDSDLDGNYPIKDFFDAGINDAFGVSITRQTVSPLGQTLVEVNGGNINITKHASMDYTIDMTGELVGGGSVTVNFRRVF